MTAPLSQFVLKVHSRCDLACDHCYVYEAADSGWRNQPRSMAEDTVRTAARRIAEHARRHGLPAVNIVLHGGEPLLVRVDGMRRILDQLKAEIEPVTALELALQTNGVLLDESFCELFVEYGVKVGVSLDGGRVANDRHRRFPHGGGSYDHVVRGLAVLGRPAYREAFAGLLCTIDVANEPGQVLEDLAALEPPAIDLLLPHATWDAPPPAARAGATPYGDWLVEAFDHWYAWPPGIRVRLFEETIHALLGGMSRSEVVGLSSVAFAVIETDGSIEQTDALKIAYEGAAATGYTVFADALDDVLRHPAVAARQAGAASLCAQCRACPLLSACGGGQYPHRYSPERGFDNPSVYCADLTRFISHVQRRVASDVAELVAG
jgi:uncharacterized protein